MAVKHRQFLMILSVFLTAFIVSGCLAVDYEQLLIGKWELTGAEASNESVGGGDEFIRGIEENLRTGQIEFHLNFEAGKKGYMYIKMSFFADEDWGFEAFSKENFTWSPRGDLIDLMFTSDNQPFNWKFRLSGRNNKLIVMSSNEAEADYYLIFTRDGKYSPVNKYL